LETAVSSHEQDRQTPAQRPLADARQEWERPALFRIDTDDAAKPSAAFDSPKAAMGS
jgi:hypothetical protein